MNHTKNDILTEKTVSMNDKKEKKKEGVWGFVKSLLMALILALIFRTFIYEPFHIPSGSMKPTLLVGDYIFVSKFSYGYSSLSLSTNFKGINIPFPHFEGRTFNDIPKRGDVVVFKLPSDNTTNYIKRLIGFPGDKIQVKHGILYINGDKIKRKRIDDFIDAEKPALLNAVPQYIETLPNGVSYRVLDEVKDGDEDNTGVYTVPPGHYFFMGDNRDNSQDSRVMSAVGFVPAENLVGRAEIKFFSSDAPIWKVWEKVGRATPFLWSTSYAQQSHD